MKKLNRSLWIVLALGVAAVAMVAVEAVAPARTVRAARVPVRVRVSRIVWGGPADPTDVAVRAGIAQTPAIAAQPGNAPVPRAAWAVSAGATVAEAVVACATAMNNATRGPVSSPAYRSVTPLNVVPTAVVETAARARRASIVSMAVVPGRRWAFLSSINCSSPRAATPLDATVITRTLPGWT